MLGRVVPDSGTIAVAGHHTRLLPLRMARHCTVVRLPQPDVPHLHGMLAMATHDICGRPWSVCIHQERHAETGRRGRGWNWSASINVAASASTARRSSAVLSYS